MKSQFTNYLSAIGMGRTFIRRVSELEKRIALILPEEITRVFVSEYIDQEDQRQFQSVFFLTPSYVAEASNFVAEESFEVDLIRQSIVNIEVNYKDYDFRSAAHASRLTLLYTTGFLSANLKASRENCDYLLSLLRDCIVPNFAPSAPSSGEAPD